MRLQDVCKLAWKHATKKRKEGSAPTFLGLEGMLALMYDNIRRAHQEKGRLNYDEVLDLTANSLFALEAVCEMVLPGGSQEFIEDHEIENPPEEKPTLLPQPARFDGWNYDAKKAAGLREWLRETNQWFLLTPEQRLGIEDAILQEDTQHEEAEDEEESEDNEDQD